MSATTAQRRATRALLRALRVRQQIERALRSTYVPSSAALELAHAEALQILERAADAYTNAHAAVPVMP